MKKIITIIISLGIAAVAATFVSAEDNALIYQKHNHNNAVSAEDDLSMKSFSRESYEKVLASAIKEQKKARKAGFEWTTIDKLLKAAKKLYKSGDSAAAIKKLLKARYHAILGQKQAIEQQGAGPHF